VSIYLVVRNVDCEGDDVLFVSLDESAAVRMCARWAAAEDVSSTYHRVERWEMESDRPAAVLLSLYGGEKWSE
jgi:hypothetical protein